jgi:hypothetical protein
MIVLTGAAMFRGRWRVSVRRLVLLMVAATLTFFGAWSGDYLHFAAAYPYYSQKIKETTGRPVKFYWGDQAVTVLDGLQVRNLLYDDTGKVNLTDHLGEDDGPGFCISTRRLIGHFFIEYVISSQNATRCKAP